MKDTLVWASGDPVSFQLWQNNKLRKDHSILYQIANKNISTNEDNYYFNPGVLQLTNRTALHPILSEEYGCTILLLHNFDTPEWLSIGCDTPCVGDLVCAGEREILYKIETEFLNLKSVEQRKWCHTSQFKRGGLCISIKWIDEFSHSATRTSGTVLLSRKKTFLLHPLLDAVSSFMNPLLLSNSNQEVVLMEYCRLFNKSSFESVDSSETVRGYAVLQSHTRNISTNYHLFECSDGSFIAKVLVCDGIIDCPGEVSSDELNCICETIDNWTTSILCKIQKVSGGKSVCSLLYNETGSGSCIQYGYSLVNKHEGQNMEIEFCGKKFFAQEDIRNDLVVDCLPNGEDEFVLKSILTHGVRKECKDKNELPCFEGHSLCYNISNICKYRLNKLNHLIPCRTGGHIEECEYFECNMMFKCPGFYCVPWSYVCDGKWDCPGGSEESHRYSCGKYRNCTNMYRCRNSKICIHLGNVCDEYDDCPLDDDESLCEISRLKCPGDCVCLSLAIKCINSSVSADDLKNKFPYVAISVLFSSKLWQNVDDILELFATVTHMHFVRNEIVSICSYVFHWKDLKLLDLSYNFISHLSTRCFHNLLYLTLIRLNNNNINIVKSQTFTNVPNLNFVDLSFNQIESLEFEIFYKISEVNRLRLNGTDINQIDANAFTNVGLKSVFTLNYHIFAQFKNQQSVIIHTNPGTFHVQISCQAKL